MHGDESNDAEWNQEFTAVTVNTDAMANAAYTEGWNAGIREGEAKGFSNGYAEALGDLRERLRVIIESSGEEGLRECLTEIEKMMPG